MKKGTSSSFWRSKEKAERQAFEAANTITITKEEKETLEKGFRKLAEANSVIRRRKSL